MNVDTAALQSLLAKARDDHEYYADQSPLTEQQLREMADASHEQNPRQALAAVVIRAIKSSDPNARFTFAHWWANGYGLLKWENEGKRHVLHDPKAITWWSFMDTDELYEALDTLLQVRPELFVKSLDPNFDRSLAIGLKAFLVYWKPIHQRSANTQMVLNLIHRAAMQITDPRWMDEDLFMEFTNEQKREFLVKHHGGALPILVRHAVADGSLSLFERFQRELINGYTDNELMEIFIELQKEGGALFDRSLGWSVASKIYLRLRVALQERGIEPHLAEVKRRPLMSNKPWITSRVDILTYHPTADSAKDLRGYEGDIIEVWFRQLRADETMPDNIVTTPFWQF